MPSQAGEPLAFEHGTEHILLRHFYHTGLGNPRSSHAAKEGCTDLMGTGNENFAPGTGKAAVRELQYGHASERGRF